MAEFADVVRRRRMTRSFTATPLPDGVLHELVTLASRAPSAGKTQGWDVVVLEGPQTARFWDITLPTERRASFRWQRLLDAPAILLPFADPGAYVDRYSEPDKIATGLGRDLDAWSAPYWTIDASMAVMTLLLAAEDAGLGALFFGVFHNEHALRASLGVPERLQMLGAIALGYPAADSLTDSPIDSDRESGNSERGRSASRPRRAADQILHHDGW